MVEEKKPKATGLGKCAGCGKALEAYVVAGEERYCSDHCVKEATAPKKK